MCAYVYVCLCVSMCEHMCEYACIYMCVLAGGGGLPGHSRDESGLVFADSCVCLDLPLLGSSICSVCKEPCLFGLMHAMGPLSHNWSLFATQQHDHNAETSGQTHEAMQVPGHQPPPLSHSHTHMRTMSVHSIPPMMAAMITTMAMRGANHLDDQPPSGQTSSSHCTASE